MDDGVGGVPVKADDSKAYMWMAIMGGAIIGILILGIFLAYALKNFAMVPFSVVIMGILAFFGVLKISRALTGSNDNEIRKSITVSMMVVYLGLLPTLAFQGLFQFKLTGNTTTDATLINQTVNQTVVQVLPSTGISETVVTSFTALVAAVLLFYFGSRTLDSYYSSVKGGKSEGSQGGSNGGDSDCIDSAKTVKETTVAKYDKDGHLIEKTVTTERVKKVKEITETTVVIKNS